MTVRGPLHQECHPPVDTPQRCATMGPALVEVVTMRKRHISLKSGLIGFSIGMLLIATTAIPAMASSWVGLYGGEGFDYPTAMVATSDGGYVLASYTESFGHGSEDLPDILILKLDSQGDIEWQEVIGTKDHTDEAFSIIETAEGRIAVAGLTYNATSGWAQAWVVLLTRRGKIIWQKAYDGQPACYARSIAECPGGGFILCGIWWDAHWGQEHPWALRLDSNGDVLWQRAFGRSDGIYWKMIGGWYSVLPDADGGYFFLGDYLDQGTNPSGYGAHLAKLDANGYIQWQRFYEEAGGSSLVRTQDGGFVLAGFWGKNVTRLDSQGNVIWNTLFHKGGLDSEPYFKGVVPNAGGGYIAMGKREREWLVGIGDDGIVEWQKEYEASYIISPSRFLCAVSSGGAAMGLYSPHEGHRVVILKNEADGSMADPCVSAMPVRTVWNHPPVTVFETTDIVPIELEPICNETHVTPSETSVNEAHSFCPVIKKVHKLKDPFRLELNGALFEKRNSSTDPFWWVTIDGIKVPEIKPVSDHKMILKGGKDLKAMLPKDKPVCIRIVPGFAYNDLYNSACYTYQR